MTAVWLWALVWAAAGAGQPLVLVRDGKALAHIEISPQASDVEKLAASELARYIERASGAKMNVVAGRQQGPAVALVCEGPPQTTTRFTVSADGDRMEIRGNCPVAVLYGAYWVLREYVGCRWFAGGEIGEVVPHRPTIAVPPGRRSLRPAFYIRAFFLGRDEEMWWALRNGLNGFFTDQFVEKLGTGVGPSLWVKGPRHAFSQLVPPKEYFAEHPEYFALIGGKRSPNGQLCTTNPTVIRIVANKMREFFEKNPDRWCFSVCPNDGYGWCECERCRALDEKLGGARRWSVRPDQPVVTDRVLWFANRVAEVGGLRDFPGRELYVYAYVNYAPPPQVEWPKPGVIPWLCHYLPACYAHPIRDSRCEANKQFYGFLRTWVEHTRGDMGFYAYTDKSMWLGLPRPVVRQMADDIKLLAELGVRRYVAQSSARNWGQMDCLYWVTARLLWNPSLDVEKLRSEWYAGFFGAAGPAMRRWYDVLDEAVRSSGRHFNADPAREGPPIFTDDVLARAQAALDEAARLAAGDETVAQRVERVRQAFDLGSRRVRYFAAVDRFYRTGDREALKTAVQLGRPWKKLRGWAGRQFAARLAELEQILETGVAWNGLGPEQELGGRKCRNTDETGPGDGKAGWAALKFVADDRKAEYRLTLVVWGKSTPFAPIICVEGRGKGFAEGGKWQRLELVHGKLSGREQWDTLVFRIRPEMLDKETMLQVVGLGGGDSQIWIAESKIEKVSATKDDQRNGQQASGAAEKQ